MVETKSNRETDMYRTTQERRLLAFLTSRDFKAKTKAINCIQECFCLEAKTEAYFQIWPYQVTHPLSTLRTLKSSHKRKRPHPCREGRCPALCPHQPSFPTEPLPKEAGPSPPPHCCQDNVGVGTRNLILPSPMASKRTRVKVGGLCATY